MNDKIYHIGSKHIRTRVCAAKPGMLSQQDAQHRVAYIVRAWLVDEDGNDLIENACKCGFTERTDTIHQADVARGVTALMEDMDEDEAIHKWWEDRHDMQRGLAANECYSKCTKMFDVVSLIPPDPDGDYHV
jgi:hypothetical protein